MLNFADWSAGATMLGTGAARVAVHDHGQGPCVTFLHGFPSSSHDVLRIQDRLDGFRVVAPDLPGFGASAKPGEPHTYTIHAAADRVESMWAHLGIDATVVAAHDYSVSVAQELLARRSPVVRGVVWMNGGLYSDLHRQTLGQQMLLDPDHGAEVAAAMDESLFFSGIEITWGQRAPLTQEIVADMWASMAHDGGSAQAHRLLHYVADRLEHGPRWIPALEQCGLPMAFVWGELDPVSGAHVADRLAERLPAVPLARLADVGHWPPLEAPDEVAAAVEDVARRAGLVP